MTVRRNRSAALIPFSSSFDRPRRGERQIGASLDNANNAIVGRSNEGWRSFACMQRRRRRKKKRSRAEDGKRGMSEDTRGVFRQPASFVHRAKGVSRQPEGVTPAYSYAGNGGRRKLESGGTRNTPRFYAAAPRPGDNVSRGLSPAERHESSLFLVHEKGRMEEVILNENCRKGGRRLWIRGFVDGYVDIYTSLKTC